MKTAEECDTKDAVGPEILQEVPCEEGMLHYQTEERDYHQESVYHVAGS
jgi:hypothetical protein